MSQTAIARGANLASASGPRWLWEPIAPTQAWLELLVFLTAAVLVFGTILLTGASRFLLAVLILPLPFLAPRWPLLTLAMALIGTLVLAGAAAVLRAPDPSQDLLRLTIQILVMGGFCLILRSLAQAQGADREALRVANAALAAARDEAALTLQRLQADISERSRLAEESRERHERIVSLYEALSEGVIELDVNGAVIGCNPAAESILGLSLAEMTGRTPQHPDWRAIHEDGSDFGGEYHPASVTLRSGQPVRDFVHGVHRPDGTLRWVSVSTAPIRAADGALRGVVASLVDVTAAQNTAAQIREQREELQSILDAIPAFVYYKDDANTILSINRQAAASIGLPPEAIVGRKTENFFAPDLAAAYLADDLEVLSQSRPKLGIIETYRPEGGECRTIRTDKIPLRGPSGRFDRLVAVATDITDVVQAQEALAQAEERLSLAVSGAQDAIFDWNLESGEAYFAPRWNELLGLAPDSPFAAMSDWRARIASTSLAVFETALHEHLEGRSETLEVELEMVTAQGHSRWMQCRARALRSDAGHAVRLAGCITDISELKAAQRELMHLANHDHLTGLANRKRLIEEIGQCRARGRRQSDYGFALLFLDFDRFKVVNDGLGHSVGDALLVSIAARLEYSSRETDLVARFGGDEFVILLRDVRAPENLSAICERVLAILAEPYRLEGQEIYSTASIGVVYSSGDDPRNADALLRDADAAMYVAKAAGRATFRIFDEAMHAKALDAVYIEQALRADPFEREFELYYQPIIELDGGQIMGFEALVRWNHPELGLLTPDRFIQVAEETGLIVQLGRWVLTQACRQIRAWRCAHGHAAGLFVNVNISKRELLAPDLVDFVSAALLEADLGADAIKLEITETAIMTHREPLTPVLEALCARGISLAMDDFGTGHSSLSALYQFPISVLKLDRSFIENLDRADSLHAIVAPIVALAGNLNLEVVAEGIETQAQLTQLRAVGCRFGQGYLFARPMDAASASEFLHARSGCQGREKCCSA